MPFNSTTISSGPYTPNGVTTNFPFFFLALSDDEVQVVMTAADGTEEILTSGFTIYDLNNPEGGLVVFNNAPVNDGRTLTIRAVPLFSQPQDFDNQGPYNPSEVNKALDRAAQRAIYLLNLLNSGAYLPGEGGVTTVTWASVQNKPATFTPSAHVHAAADVTSGVFDAARIPNLAASKITSGTFDAARVPSLDASKITSGVLDPARVPPLPSGVVASGDITTLTVDQQNAIVEGVIVTINTGDRYVYSGAGSKTSLASYTQISDATPDWTQVASKPAKVTNFAALTGGADKLAYFSGADALSQTDLTATGRALLALASQAATIAYTSPLTTKGDLYVYTNAPARLGVGADGQVLIADSSQASGLRWGAQTGSGGGVQTMPNFSTVYSGNGDGVTNNDAAFTAAEASAYAVIWLPEGRYLTTKATTDLTKRYVGPGIIFRGAGNGSYPNYSRYSTEVHPTVDPLWAYGLAEDNTFGQTETYVVDAGMRKNFDRYLGTPGFPPYFWAPSTPHFLRFYNNGGFSGFSGLTTGAITAGVTTSVGVTGGTTGWNVGDEIGFAGGMDGVVTETRVLTGVGGGVISWSTPLDNDYPAGSTLMHGYRTMQAAYCTIVNHTGGGDCYIHTGRMFVNYDMLDSQTAFEHGSTGALFGGEIVIQKPGNYATGWEAIYQDTGNDAGIAARVESYVRTVDTGARGVFWIHDLAKMDGAGTGYAAYGLKPIDGVYVAALAAKTGLDFTRSAFSVAAVALPLEQKIAFDAQIVGAGPGNGNGWVATTDGTMYARGSLVSGVKVLELQNNGYRLRLQANGGLTTNAGFTTSSNVLAGGNVTGATLQLPDGSGLFIEGGVLRLKKAGVTVASW